MYYKNRKNKKNYLYILIVIVVILFILFNIKLEFIKTNFITNYIQDISLIFNRVNSSNNKDEEYNNLLKENKLLEKKNNELKEMLDINTTLYDKDYIIASVINRDLNYWYDSLTISKGKKDLIEPNMAVTYKGYLVGKVTKVSNHNSIIRLLSSVQSNNKVSVKIKSNDYVYGLLTSYDNKTKYYKVENIGCNVDIKKDSIVYTTGFSDIFPSDIEIGKVKKIKKDNFGLSYIIYVEPSINLDNIDYVTILKRK